MRTFPDSTLEGADSLRNQDLDMGAPLAVQWLGLCASTAGDTGWLPGLGSKIHPFHPANTHTQKKKTKQNTLQFPAPPPQP